jgi:hypothetical protein
MRALKPRVQMLWILLTQASCLLEDEPCRTCSRCRAFRMKVNERLDQHNVMYHFYLGLMRSRRSRNSTIEVTTPFMYQCFV